MPLLPTVLAFKSFTLKIANHLAYPVAVFVNERSVMSVLGGAVSEQTLPRTGQPVTVEWRLVRPAHPSTRPASPLRAAAPPTRCVGESAVASPG